MEYNLKEQAMNDRDPPDDDLRAAKAIIWCCLGSLACLVFALVML